MKAEMKKADINIVSMLVKTYTAIQKISNRILNIQQVINYHGIEIM